MRGTMLAERHDSRTKEVRLEEIPVPEPGAGEVLVEVAYCGICQKDLGLIQAAQGQSHPHPRSALSRTGLPASEGR